MKNIFGAPLAVIAFAALLHVSQGKLAGATEVNFLPDDTPASCGCFAWYGDKLFEKGKLIYQEIETSSKNYLNMSFDGKTLALKKK